MGASAAGLGTDEQPAVPPGPDAGGGHPSPLNRAGRWLCERRARTIALALVAVGLLVGGGAAGWGLRGLLDDPAAAPVEVTVDRPVLVVGEDEGGGSAPDLIGLTEADARQALVSRGLAEVVVQVVPAAGEAGIVVAQSPGPGEALADSFVLSISGEATVPDLVGRPGDEGRQALADLGARVVVERVWDPAAAEGTILAVAPAAGEALTQDVTLTLAAAPSSVFLAELDSIESNCSSGQAGISGQPFDNSVTCQPGGDEAAAVEYVIDRAATRFDVTVGLDDGGATGPPVVFRVLADGAVVAEAQVAFGEEAAIEAPVAGALRLRIEAVAPGLGTECCPDRPTAVWGDARLVGSPDAIDALASPEG